MKYPPIGYHDYLKLDTLLSAQEMRSEKFGKTAHDELLFITVHQTYELWFKQILFEIDSVMRLISNEVLADEDISTVDARLARTHSIIKMSLQHIDILETMTPLDFLDFRDFLYPASGFQSFQFRLLEIKLGLRQQDRLTYNEGPFYQHLLPAQQSTVKTAMESPSLFDLIQSWLERTPFIQSKDFSFWKVYQNSVEQMLAEEIQTVNSNPKLSLHDKDRSINILKKLTETFAGLFNEEKYSLLRKQGQFRLSFKAIHAALFIQLYREKPILQMPFQILSHLMDLDEVLTHWRYRHAQMVQRMIGHKIGTGGSSGHDYLKQSTEQHKIFQDFVALASFLIPRTRLPKLPEELCKKMSF